MPIISPYKDLIPTIHDTAFIAENAFINGDVEIGEEASIWYGCVLRGDVDEIKVGARSNIQDGSTLHSTRDVQGVYVGDDVTIGHMCLIHACTIESNGFVGMGSVVLDEAVIEGGAMLAAGSLLTPGKRIPKGELWAGRPAKFMRALTEADYEMMRDNAQEYVDLSRQYLK